LHICNRRLAAPNTHGNGAPLPLTEAQHAQHATRHMPGENGEPDVDRVELPHLLDYETDPERHEDLRDHRDVQRTLRISGPLHPPRVGQRHGDEQPGNAEHMEKLDTDVHDDRVVHSEHGEQLPWQEQEEQSHDEFRPALANRSGAKCQRGN